MHITPTLASGIEWASVDPAANKPWLDGPLLNARIAALTLSRCDRSPWHDFLGSCSALLHQCVHAGQCRACEHVLPLRELLNRKARSGTQDQVVILFSLWPDFLTTANADAYDTNIRWLASRPWIEVVTPDEIASGQVDLSQPADGMGDTWGTVNRGAGLSLALVAQDFIDHATQENYNNWYFGQAGREDVKHFVVETTPACLRPRWRW
jgi:hypothetical protein